MASTIMGYLQPGIDFVKDHPYAVGGGAALVLGAGALAYKYLRPAPTNPENEAERAMIERQNRTKEVMDKLLITEYHLPTSKDEKNQWATDPTKPQPIFDKATTKEIDIVAKMIEKAIQHQSPLPNIILKGPAGVGKTMLGEALCYKTGIGFIRIPSGAMEKHIKTGNHITAFRDVVKVAESYPEPTIIIMDDGEELVAQRPEAQKAEAKDGAAKAHWLVEQERLSQTIAQRRTALVNAILEESGKAYRKIGFCITTNRDEVIDTAFKTRSKIIAVKSPDFEERKQIIITHLPTAFKFDKDMLGFFHKGRLEEMAAKTEGFTGRNIVKSLEEMYSCVQLDNGNITQDIVDAAILAMKASVERSGPKKGPSVTHSIVQLGQSIFNSLAATVAV